MSFTDFAEHIGMPVDEFFQTSILAPSTVDNQTALQIRRLCVSCFGWQLSQAKDNKEALQTVNERACRILYVFKWKECI